MHFSTNGGGTALDAVQDNANLDGVSFRLTLAKINIYATAGGQRVYHTGHWP